MSRRCVTTGNFLGSIFQTADTITGVSYANLVYAMF